jgi:dTDP-glucose 4,6-dehydratase
MQLLVTGGLGFIGSNFIRKILQSRPDIEIVNVDNLSTGANPANLKEIKNHRYRFIKGDITNFKLVSKLIRNTDVVVNFAAETHVDRSIADPRSFIDSNVFGTYTILEATRKNNRGTKIIQISTDEVYGDIHEGSSREGDPLKPSSPYASSKAAADMFVLAYHRTYELDVTITRCTNNFGPHQHPEKLIPKTIVRAHLNLSVPVYGRGNQIRDWIYVIDHCEALTQVMEKGKSGEIYNISAGNEMSNLKIVESILELLGKPKELIRPVEDRPGHDLRYSLDSSKIRSSLGWSPRYSFKDSLIATVEWYVKNKSLWKPLATKKTLGSSPWKLGY